MVLGQHVHFNEGAGVKQMVDSLPGDQFPLAMLLFNVFFPSPRSGGFFHFLELFDAFFQSRHDSPPSFGQRSITIGAKFDLAFIVKTISRSLSIAKINFWETGFPPWAPGGFLLTILLPLDSKDHERGAPAELVTGDESHPAHPSAAIGLKQIARFPGEKFLPPKPGDSFLKEE
jgi:hypothetical protein